MVPFRGYVIIRLRTDNPGSYFVTYYDKIYGNFYTDKTQSGDKTNFLMQNGNVFK